MNNARSLAWGTGWISVLLWAAIVPAILLWPLFLPGVELATGPLGTELWMGRGIRSAMNQVLLNGEFPEWNPWLGTGSVALIFGASPFSLFTPLELLAGAGIPVRIIVVEVFLTFFALALGFQLGLRAFRISPWIGVPALLVALLADPLWVSAHVPWWMGAITIVYPLLLLALSAYLYDKRTDKKRRAVSFAFAVSLIIALGAKTEVVYMFCCYLAVALCVHHAIRRWVGGVPLPVMVLLRQWGKQYFIFGIVPVCLFAWQVPLVLSLLRITGERVAQPGAGSWLRLGKAAEYLVFSVAYSHSLRAIATFLMATLLLPAPTTKPQCNLSQT